MVSPNNITRRRWIQNAAGLIVPFVAPVISWPAIIVRGPVVAAAAGHSLIDSSTTTNEVRAVGNNGNAIFRSQRGWSHASNQTIGRLTWLITKTAGTITGKTFHSYIYAVSGSFDMGAQLAKSIAVVCPAEWSATEVDFDFAVPYGTTGGTGYCLAISMNETQDGSNYASIASNSTALAINGYLEGHNGAGVGQDGGTRDAWIKIWT